MKLAVIALLLAPSLAFAQTVPGVPTVVAPLEIQAINPVDPAKEVSEITDNDGEANGFEVKGLKHLWPNVIGFTSVTYGTLSTDPRWRFRGAVDWSISDRLSIGASVERVTSRQGLGDDGDFVVTPGYTVANVKAVYALTHSINVGLIVANLTNDHYFDALSAPGADKGQSRTVRGFLEFHD